MIYALPGMGADRRMYPEPWGTLPECVFVDWPEYRGEKSLREIAVRVAEEFRIGDGAVLVGSSLGGMVACEIAKVRALKALVLVGSATSKDEVSALLRAMSPLIGLAPVEFIQRAAGKLPGELMQMFERSDAGFIRAMSRAIVAWDGLGDGSISPLRIHGRSDRVIPLPDRVDLALDGGHLIAMTHAAECVAFVRERMERGWR